MKHRLLNLGMILGSLLGYLEWGQGNSTFLFQAEIEVISKLFGDFASTMHPFTLLPLFGQILLIATLFQQRPNKILTYIGIGCIGVLLAFICFIGIISLNIKVFASTLPFLALTVWIIRENRKTNAEVPARQ